MVTPTEQDLEQKRARLRQWIPEDQHESATRGVDHMAVFAKDLEATAAFYAEVMGMPVINVTEYFRHAMTATMLCDGPEQADRFEGGV